MDLEMELTPLHLSWDIYGTGARDGVDSHKVQLQHDLRWDIDETSVGDGVNPQKIQHKYGSRDGVDPSKIDLTLVLIWWLNP